MMSLHNNWRNFLAEGKFVTTDEKLLREITDDELDSISAVIGNLGPEDKAFNHIFKGKNRVLIPFVTRDYESDLGKFVQFFEAANYDVDWDSGMLSGVITIENTSPGAIMRQLFGDSHSIDREPKKKKIQMKVGKLLSKVKSDIEKYNALKQKAFNHPEVNRRYDFDLTGNDIETALEPKEVFNYYRLSDQIMAYVGNVYLTAQKFIRNPDLMDEMAEYWKKNADYIKTNLSSLEDDQYAIVITREPIDIFRMSDFDDIASCHSPASRTDGTGEYFKCAVAEAKGHGAVAYVVSRDDLKDVFGTDDLAEIENDEEFQEDELFKDDKRYFSGDMEPLSRLRLRQLRYYGSDEYAMRQGDTDSTQLAVPESAVYGMKFPDLAATIDRWAKETQSEEIANIPREDGKVNFSRFVKFGGSYEDNNITRLTLKLLGLDPKGENVAGFIRKNEDTEDDINSNLISPRIAAFQSEINELLNEYSMKYIQIRNTEVEEEDGFIHISPSVYMKVSFAKEDLKRYPTYSEAQNIAYEIADTLSEYVQWVGDKNRATFAGAGGASNDGIELFLPINIEGLSVMDASYVADSRQWEDLLDALNTIDDRGEGFVDQIFAPLLKTNGLMEGGEILDLGYEIENGDFSSYEWDIDVEGDVYDARRGEEFMVAAAYRVLTDFEGLDLVEVNRLIRTRDFWIRLRMAMHTPVFEEQEVPGDKRYYVPIEKYFYDSSPDTINFKITYFVSDDSPDIQVEIFKNLIEYWDDEDKMDAVVVDVLKKMVKQGIAFQPMKDLERDINIPNEREVQFESRRRVQKKMLYEANKPVEQKVFDNWRKFLK
jgi:hypothetical protein